MKQRLLRTKVQTDPQKFPIELRNALSSVVRLRSSVPDDAFTAGTLGTEREGYGAVIASSGLVLTIGYLTAEAETIWITIADGRAFSGHVLAYDFETGFGLVQILEQVDLPALPLGQSEKAKVGDQVFVAGSGKDAQTLVASIVARQEFAGYWEYALDDAIFTAPAHPNWGGTAVINLAGELIGIGSLLVQGADQNDETEDINMVVPVDILKPRLDALLKSGHSGQVPRPWLGIYATEVSNHVVIMGVASRGPASDFDLRQGDIVLNVSGKDVNSLGGFYRRIWELGPAGVEVPLQILRDNQPHEITIKSGDRAAFLKSPTLQ